MIIHGIELDYRPRKDLWVACLGPDYFVHFSNPSGNCWRAFRPFALEPIITAKTLNECVLMVKQHYDRRRQESRARIKLILESL